MRAPPLRLILAWLALVALLGGNILLAYLAPHFISLGANLGVAVAMAAIVLAVFMELDRGVSLKWVFAAGGFCWLALLIGLTAADYLTRYSFAPT